MGRPLNKKYFGADVDSVAAVATYNTNGAGAITAVNVTSGGSNYAGNFSVTVTGGASGTALLSFTVVAGVVTAGAITSQSGAFALTATNVAIAMPASGGADANPAFQILGTGRIAGQAAAPVIIIKQKSSRKYLCALASNTTIRGVLTTANTGTPAVGELSIPVAPFGGGTEYAKVITGRRIKTFASKNYVWSDLGAAADSAGEADVGTDSPK